MGELRVKCRDCGPCSSVTLDQFHLTGQIPKKVHFLDYSYWLDHLAQ